MEPCVFYCFLLNNIYLFYYWLVKKKRALLKAQCDTLSNILLILRFFF